MEIDLEPSVIVAGQRYVGAVIVRTPKADRVAAIHVHIARLEAWKHGTGAHAPKARHTEVLFEGTVAGPTTLSGEMRFPIEFEARADLPPPYRATPAYQDYTATVKVTRKGWFTSKNEFKLVELALRTHPFEGARGAAITLVSEAASPHAPRLEVGLPARCYATGERIDGTVALFNLDERSTRELEITLTPMLELRGWKQPWATEGVVRTTRVTIAASAQSQPFSVPLADAPPTFGGVTHSLDWRLRLATKDLQVETRIVIVPASTRLGGIGAAPGLTETSDRDRLAAFAQRFGWQVVRSPGSSFVADSAARSTVGPYSILVGIAHRGIQGRRIVVAIDLPPLPIARTELPGLVEWTDSRLRYEQAAPVLDEAALEAMRVQLDHVLRTVDRLRVAVDPTTAASSPFR